MKQSLIAKFDEAELRVEKVVFLALQPYLALSSDAEEMLEDIERVVCDTGIAYKHAGSEEDFDGTDETAENLRMAGFTGPFILVAHAREGWGFYETRWFYGTTLDDAVQASVACLWEKRELGA